MNNGDERTVTTARQLARELGLSVATVSRALNNHPDVSPETRMRVVQMADSLGYMPRVGRRPTNVIGLVYPTDPVRATYGNFESAMLAGVLDGVVEQRYDVTIIDVNRDRHPSDSYTQFFRSKGIRGAIVRRIHPGSTLPEEIADEGFPCVLIADRSEQPNVNFIYTESLLESRRAVEHLIALGHRRIALGVHSMIDSDHRDRRNGYVQALDAAGIEIDPSLIFQAPATTEGGASMLDQALAHADAPTAIYFTDPLTTLGALHRCLVRGVNLPDDISVVGFDDGDVRDNTFPRCSAVCQDARQMGLEAAKWLTRSLAAGGPLPSFREVRSAVWSGNDSTGAPRPQGTKIGGLAGRGSPEVNVPQPGDSAFAR